jgi:hypothetical protein
MTSVLRSFCRGGDARGGVLLQLLHGCRIEPELTGKAREPRALAVRQAFIGADDGKGERIQILPRLRVGKPRPRFQR